jgi:hypothetical protein
VIWQVSSACGRVVALETDQPVPKARVKLRKALERGSLETLPSDLSCLSSFKKGSIIYSGKTNKRGEFRVGALKSGYYWLVIRGKETQVVRVIYFKPEDSKDKCPSFPEYHTSETGLVGNMCDVLQAEDFM